MAKAGSLAAARAADATRVHDRSPLRQLRQARPRVVPIQRESLEEQVYARLRSSIIDRTIQPGQRIPVDRLAQELGISRTPILNALKRLAQERVVDCLSRRGIYVRRFSKREMARLFEVREALEGMAARLAAPRIAPTEVRRLSALFRGFDGRALAGYRAPLHRARPLLPLALGGAGRERAAHGGAGFGEHDVLRLPGRGGAAVDRDRSRSIGPSWRR